jgi:hypothetical protein
VSISSDDSNKGGDEFHRGHDLETGLLSRMRELTDVFPWLRLARTLRVAGSPPLVLLTAIVFSIWRFGETLIGVDGGRDAMRLEASSPLDFVGQSSALVSSHIGGSIPTSIFNRTSSQWWWLDLLAILWSLLIWAPIAMLLARQGALLTAGRTMVGVKPGLSHAIRRSPPAWLAALVPLACVIAMGLLITGVGWLARLSGGFLAWETLLAILASLVAIPCGILAFGAAVAIPLGWAALVNERDPDALDSLSRGYEYLFRRPLQLVLYAALSLGILSIIGALATGIAWAASSVAAAMLDFSGPSTVPQLTQQILQLFPTVVVLTLLWSLVGGVYLLLRYDAGGQDVEDLWQPSPRATPSLPSIPPH